MESHDSHLHEIFRFYDKPSESQDIKDTQWYLNNLHMYCSAKNCNQIDKER